MRQTCALTLVALTILNLPGATAATAGSQPGNRCDMETDAGTLQPKGTVESRTLSVRIERPYATVYDFLVDPANWNRWATGLGKSLRRTIGGQSGGGWIADSGEGIIQVRFTPKNEYGVLDHTVTRPSGAHVYVPMRLIASGTGCELVFTLFREPGMIDAQYDSDANWVQRDLNGLKDLLEK